MKIEARVVGGGIVRSSDREEAIVGVDNGTTLAVDIPNGGTRIELGGEEVVLAPERAMNKPTDKDDELDEI